MTGVRFTVGDRVRLHTKRRTVEAGALGTVQHVFEVVDAYMIVFDDHPAPRFVWGTLVEQADTPADTGQGLLCGA
jgi:hypothetical protein